jgi:hypothetical protein
VLKREEDEDKIVNFIGRPFGYFTGKPVTHTFLPKNKQLDISILVCCIWLSELWDGAIT